LNRERTRNGLGVFFIDSLAVTEALVVFAGQGYRADVCTVTAAGTLGRVYVAGLLGDDSLKISAGPLDFIDFSAWNQVDVQMPADLDQFR
jgi:hypothetical protein